MFITIFPTKIKKHGAFTLVELSIVIVIIGLIVSGVTAGISLVKQAQYRSVLTDVDKIKAAGNAFILQYGGIAGDIINADKFWPSCDATPTNCNGNGNKLIDTGISDVKNELYRAWQQLAAAGLILGTYTGIGYGAVPGNEGHIGQNCPVSSIAKAGFYFIDTFVYLGGFVTNYWPHYPMFKAAEIYSWDVKVDDGKATTGLVQGFDTGYLKGYGAGCTSGNTYLLTDTNISCLAKFKLR